VATTFEVLAEPTRRKMLDLLLERPHVVGELTRRLGLSQPGTSKHLRVLRDVGLVQVRQDKQRRWYELRPDPLIEMDAWLQPYRALWAERLDALERHLDAMPGEPPDPPAGGPAGEPPGGAADTPPETPTREDDR